jgi:hypothetical protein
MSPQSVQFAANTEEKVSSGKCSDYSLPLAYHKKSKTLHGHPCRNYCFFLAPKKIIFKDSSN